MTDRILTEDEIKKISKQFIRCVGSHCCHEPAIREDFIDDFYLEIEKQLLNRIKEKK